MKPDTPAEQAALDLELPTEFVTFNFDLTRRGFVQALGAGLLITVMPDGLLAQQRRGGGRSSSDAATVSARVHIARDGVITVMTGKVEGGQGARAEITQAAAEELRVSSDRVTLLMADTARVPDDGITAGSRTTPSTLPAVRQGCAGARVLLLELAAKRWNVEPAKLQVRDGRITGGSDGRALSYADLAADEEDLAGSLGEAVPSDIALTPVPEWRVMGTSLPRPNARSVVTGEHRFPSDIVRPGMLYGKVLRPPSYGATLVSVDLERAKRMPGVVAVRDGEFFGVTAPNAHAAAQAIEVLAESAEWKPAPHPSSSELFEHLRRHARGGMPANPFARDLDLAAKKLKSEYQVAYVQHSPLEPRAAVAEWQDGSLTVWTGTQNPFGCRSELARAFNLDPSRVRVIVPDFGAGFGGKHTGETGVEAARLARAAGKPVSLRWTREEEFTWASFRPAALITAEAGLNDDGVLTSWHFVNVNSGPSAIETPYRAGNARSQFVQSDAPLRHGSYRALAATANNFARECFMDELAGLAGRDPLEFRLAHLENDRLRAVLEAAAERFGWTEKVKRKEPNVGVGLACGTEKGSYVAACVEIEINRDEERIVVRHVCEVFECGAIVNPENLHAQVAGCIIMGMGPALTEAMEFEEGKIQNASYRKYVVPRFKDVPELDIHLLNRPDLPSVGGGETPIIAIAPAIANAVFQATGRRVRSMPIRLEA